MTQPSPLVAAPTQESRSENEIERAYDEGGVRFDQRSRNASRAEGPAAIHPERTAMARNKPSVPTRLVEPLLRGEILDYGAGRGKDTDHLRAEGFKVAAYDPFYFPKKPSPEKRFDWVMLNYVLNVIATPAERVKVLQDVRGRLKPGGRLLVSVRGDREINSAVKKDWRRQGDGWVTSRDTFQKGYTQKELEADLTENGFKIVSVLAPLIVVAEKTAAR